MSTSTKKKAGTRARTKARGKAAAPLCRLVFVRPGTEEFRYGKWERESAQLHSRVAKFNAKPRRKFDVYIQVPPPATDCAQPAHIPAVGAKPGQWVYRFTFSDGGTGDLDRYKHALTLQDQRDRLHDALEIERVTLSHADYMRRNASSERARNSAAERRQIKNMDKRDDEVQKTAAAEKKKQVYGYIMRTAQAFPNLRIDAVKQIIRKKIG